MFAAAIDDIEPPHVVGYNALWESDLLTPHTIGRSMSTIAPLRSSPPLQEHVYLPGVSYPTYEALVTELEDRRRLRITYFKGRMEIMSPLQDHERPKKLIGQMIEAITEELGIPRLSCGSTTFKDKLLDCGLEPDECYYIQHEAEVRARTVEVGVDPMPDLVVEVDVTTSVIDRFPIYAALGFPEIWQYVDGEIVIHLLQENNEYKIGTQSLALPMVSVQKLAKQLERCKETDETSWIRTFRQWVRDGMK
jgi:Uma2 family endonuclease